MKFRVPNTEYYKEGTGMVCEVCCETLEKPKDVYALCTLDGEHIVTLCRQHFELAKFMRESVIDEMNDMKLI